MRFLTLVFFTSLIASPLVAQTWDPAPFQSETPIPADGLPPERTAFFQWLRGVTSLTDEQGQRARERVYTYISELAKRNKGAFPARGDTDAELFFSAATALGVAGAEKVQAALGGAANAQVAPMPSGMTISFDAPLFMLGSDDNSWAVCFPYYFMPAPAGRQTPNNGVVTELAMVSTLVAPDGGTAGSSQATILIAAAPVADSAKHVALWVHRLAVSAEPAPEPGMAGQWFRSTGLDAMRREAIVRRLPQRVVVLAYLGLPGTYESNRPHFVDLARTLGPARCAAGPGSQKPSTKQ